MNGVADVDSDAAIQVQNMKVPGVGQLPVLRSVKLPLTVVPVKASPLKPVKALLPESLPKDGAHGRRRRAGSRPTRAELTALVPVSVRVRPTSTTGSETPPASVKLSDALSASAAPAGASVAIIDAQSASSSLRRVRPRPRGGGAAACVKVIVVLP